MEYFNKFLRAGSQIVTPKAPTDHAQEFHKSWTVVKNTLLYPDERQLTKGIKSTNVPAHLQTMVDSLVWESTRTEQGTFGACLEYLLKNDVLGQLVKLSEPDRPFGIQAEVLQAIQNMVVLMDEQFLVHSAVHKAVLRLLRNCVGDDIQEQLDGKKVMGAAGNATRSQPSEYEEDLVNLLCILCSRIRTYRELLMIFFHDKHWYRSEPLFSVEEEEEEEEEEHAPSSDDPSQPKKQEYEFLLFNYLLRFVHREGQIGDFARAGLLFLMDVAMSPGEPTNRLGGEDAPPAAQDAPEQDPVTEAALALAEYIVDGDFSEVLGAGLAAVYSVLPTKLAVQRPPPKEGEEGGMVIGGTPETEDELERAELQREKEEALGVEQSSSLDFRARLDHFLKLLEFLQDILRRNVHEGPDGTLDPSSLVGSSIVQSILDAVRRIFLENVFYPSILETSDKDGSTVAVISYIDIILTTLHEGQLADVFVDFLTSEDSDAAVGHPRARKDTMMLTNAPPQSKSAAPLRSKRERRKSTAMQLLELEAPDSTKQTDYITSGRFTMKDLVLDNLRSTSQPAAAAAALQLLQTMLLEHCQLCTDRLLVVIHDPNATSFPAPSMMPRALQDMTQDSKGGLSTIHDEDEDEDEKFIYPGSEDEFRFPTAEPEPMETLFGPVFHQPGTTYSTHEREMGLYLQLVSRVDPAHNGDAFSTGYDHYLRDALISIQSQACFQTEIEPEARSKLKHRLNPNDPILSLVLDSLRRFFANTPEFNIALTGVLASLAFCPDRSLAGWLTFAVPTIEPSFDLQLEVDADLQSYQEGSDGDDRSVDFQIDEKLASDHGLPAASMDERSRPVVHSIFLGLVAQLERYRQLVDNFDKYLLERRQGLLFNENLTDALTLALEPEFGAGSASGTTTPRRQSLADVPRPTDAPTTPQKAAAKPTLAASASSLMSLLTPKKKARAPALTPGEVVGSPDRKIAASPFGPHYERTRAIEVEPFEAPVPAAGPWTPAPRAPGRSWHPDDEDVFGGQWGEPKEEEDVFSSGPARAQGGEQRTVTLSHLLDNVVILEESIKELAAIIHARRSLGIDAVRYV